MAETLPKYTPDAIMAGATAKWTLRTTALGQHRDPADSWTLTYQLTSADSEITFSGSDNGDGSHLITLAKATTAAYPPGVYTHVAYVDDGTERFYIEQGSICIEPDPADMGPTDRRSWAVRVLAAVEATIEGKATSDQASLSIAGRSISRYTPEELMVWRDRLKVEVGQEQAAERIAKGLGGGQSIRVRF